MSSWITANLLTLNCSNEFFLADSKRQLPIIQNSSAPPIQLAALVLSLMDTILFYDIYLSLNPTFIIFVKFAVSAVTLTPQQFAQLLPRQSLTTNLITVILFTTTSLSLN